MIILISMGVLAAIMLVIIMIFALPQLSPIPYFPSNRHDLPLILKSLRLENNMVLFDLGAGDGIIIFSAAKYALQKGLNTRFVAVEMNPILALILHLRRLMHPNRSRITILGADMFKVDYQQYVMNHEKATVYIYVSPRFIPRIKETVTDFFPHFTMVSYFYPIEKNQQPTHSGIHDIFILQT